MVKYKIICVGSIKEKFYVEAINEYVKRLSRFSSVQIVELKEGKSLESEGEEILARLSGYVVVLDIKGDMLSSEELAQKIDKVKQFYSEICFVIGSSCGLSNAVKEKADMRLSFSRMTFPHQMFRVVLLEQVYRAETILGNIAYHK